MTFFRFQELSDVGRSDFQFQRRRYAVKRLDPLARHVLAMLVQVNEARRDPTTRPPLSAADETRAIFPSRMPTLRTSIQSGFRIQDAAPLENEIVLLCRCDGR